jgi:predicted nucleic acid-binding protein
MIAPVFVDTNVLLYAVDEADLKKHEEAKLWRAELWKSRQGRISFQVLQEFYWVGTRKWPALRGRIQAEIHDLLEWRPVVIDPVVLARSWKIQERYRISFWDALIVAAAKAAPCRYLLTEDLQAGQEYDGVTVVNPFRREPGEILGV